MMNKDELYLWLCKETAAVPFCYDPKIYSISRMARILGVTKYRIRKLIKQLEADGLVEKTYIGGLSEDYGVYCYHGWSLTESATETELYKQCDEEAIAEANRILNEP